VGMTICGATYERQIAVETLAKEVQIIIIAGGKNSSNTKKLFQIASKINSRTYLVETKDDLDMKWFEGIEKVGISAGASTPKESIIEIERKIKGEVL
jgi:4-hydroxy-3-methylbut-2-enyl diphosphate reductase